MPRRRPPRAGALRDLSPTKIATQIALLQTGFYLVAFILITFTTLVAGQPWSVGLFFDWRNIRGDTTTGWMLALCWELDAVVGVVLLLLLINRSKLIPDFALSLHTIHLIFTTLYTGSIPQNTLWWGLQFTSTTIMMFLGIWACQRRELQPLSFGGGGNNAAANDRAKGGARIERPKETPGLPPEGGMDLNGPRRGSGLGGWLERLRGGGEDGKGTYEMAKMDERQGEV